MLQAPLFRETTRPLSAIGLICTQILLIFCLLFRQMPRFPRYNVHNNSKQIYILYICIIYIHPGRYTTFAHFYFIGYLLKYLNFDFPKCLSISTRFKIITKNIANTILWVLYYKPYLYIFQIRTFLVLLYINYFENVDLSI